MFGETQRLSRYDSRVTFGRSDSAVKRATIGFLWAYEILFAAATAHVPCSAVASPVT